MIPEEILGIKKITPYAKAKIIKRQLKEVKKEMKKERYIQEVDPAKAIPVLHLVLASTQVSELAVQRMINEGMITDKDLLSEFVRRVKVKVDAFKKEIAPQEQETFNQTQAILEDLMVELVSLTDEQRSQALEFVQKIKYEQ